MLSERHRLVASTEMITVLYCCRYFQHPVRFAFMSVLTSLWFNVYHPFAHYNKQKDHYSWRLLKSDGSSDYASLVSHSAIVTLWIRVCVFVRQQQKQCWGHLDFATAVQISKLEKAIFFTFVQRVSHQSTEKQFTLSALHKVNTQAAVITLPPPSLSPALPSSVCMRDKRHEDRRKTTRYTGRWTK